MSRTYISIVLMEFINVVSQKLKSRIFYSSVMDPSTPDISQLSKRFPKYCKPVFGGQPCFATLMLISHHAIDANEEEKSAKDTKLNKISYYKWKSGA